MKRIILLALATLGCADVTPRVAPAATAELLTSIGDRTTIIESVTLFGGKLYTTDWTGRIWEVDPAAPTPKQVGALPLREPCGILGEVADSAGNLLITCADDGTVWRVARARLGAADFDPKKDATRFITGAGHANGIAIGADGHVWISGGDIDTLYHAGPEGGKAIVFAGGFSPLSPDTTIGPRVYVANGAAVDSKGNVYTMNTGTGTIWRLEVKPGFQVGAITKVAESPDLIGADGVVVGAGDTLFATQNFRNTFSRISQTGEITVLVPSGPTLRFPAELVKDGKVVYIANLNFPYGANAAVHRPGATIAKVTLP